MDITYERMEWEDFPSTETPINAENLNHLEEGIAGLYSDRYDMQSNIAYVEDDETASKDYIPNSYLMRGGLFYKVKKTILYGDSFDSGEDGNIEHVDVSSQFGSGGGGSTGCVELTQAQYDALSDEAKMLDVIYLITDSPDNYLDEVFGDFATVEYTDTASKAYAVGDYLVYDNKFYRVSDDIAQDDTIIPGTNVEQTTVGEEVKALDEKTDPVYIINSPLADLQTTLQSYWSTAFPADGIPRLAKVSATGGDVYGTINLYGYGQYGSGLLTRYDGSFYKVKLVAGTVTVTEIPDKPVIVERRQATHGAIAAGSQIEIKMDLSRAGYTGVPGYVFTVSGCIVNNIYNQNTYNDGRVTIRNMTSAAVSSGTVYVNMIYVKT